MARVSFDSEPASIEFVGREEGRYLGPEGQASFLATSAMRGGEVVRRGGRVVEAVDIATIRWMGDRADQPVSVDQRERIVATIRHHLKAEGVPYQLRHPSGELEDEAGRLQPGFRSALPSPSIPTVGA